jgi:hypothetical protein
MDKITVTLSATLAEANLVLAERSNGSLTGTSAGKGGRAWLEGEWCLAELEALCLLLRHEAGDGADGIMETLATWASFNEENEALISEVTITDTSKPKQFLPEGMTAETWLETVAAKDDKNMSDRDFLNSWTEPDSKPKQPIYYVSLKDAIQALALETELKGKYRALAYGNSDPEIIEQRFREMAGEKDVLNLSKACNHLDSIRTTKMVASANTAIEALIRRLNSVRFESPAAAKEQPVEENTWVEVPLIKFKSVVILESTGERILHSQITGSQMEETALLRALEKFKAKGHISCEHGFPEKDPNGAHNDYVKRVSGVRLDRAVGVLDASTIKYHAPTETEAGYVTAMVRAAGPFKDQLEFSKLSTDSIPHFGMRAFSNDHISGDVYVKEIAEIVTFDLISK